MSFLRSPAKVREFSSASFADRKPYPPTASDLGPPRDVAPLVLAPSPGPWPPSPHTQEREFSNLTDS